MRPTTDISKVCNHHCLVTEKHADRKNTYDSLEIYGKTIRKAASISFV